MVIEFWYELRWRHNKRDSVSNHQPHDCLLNRLFRRRSKKSSKLRVTGLCVGNSPGTGEFPAQMASYAENLSIWWRHHGNREMSIYVVQKLNNLPMDTECYKIYTWFKITTPVSSWWCHDRTDFHITGTFVKGITGQQSSDVDSPHKSIVT